MMNNKKVYKSFNQFNCCKLTLTVDDVNREAVLYKGMDAPLGYDVKTTSKKIKEQAADLARAGYVIKEV